MENIEKKIYFLLINLIPVKSIRKFLREKYNDSIDYNYHIINSAIIKKEVFKKNKEKYNTVVLGSSHCEFAFNPDFFNVPAFNFGIMSADNLTIYSIYKNIIKNSSAKNIVVMYDVFSRGSNNSFTNDYKKYYCHLKYILGTDYKKGDMRVKYFCKKYSKKIIKNVDYNFNGYEKNLPMEISMNSLKERCNSHLKIHNKPSQENWIVKLINDCINDGKNFVLVLSPAQQCYKNELPSSDELFGEISNKINNILSGVSIKGGIVDFYSSNIFDSKKYWKDMDHLNNEGAEFFSEMLSNEMYKLGVL